MEFKHLAPIILDVKDIDIVVEAGSSHDVFELWMPLDAGYLLPGCFQLILESLLLSVVNEDAAFITTECNQRRIAWIKVTASHLSISSDCLEYLHCSLVHIKLKDK